MVQNALMHDILAALQICGYVSLAGGYQPLRLWVHVWDGSASKDEDALSTMYNACPRNQNFISHRLLCSVKVALLFARRMLNQVRFSFKLNPPVEHHVNVLHSGS